MAQGTNVKQYSTIQTDFHIVNNVLELKAQAAAHRAKAYELDAQVFRLEGSVLSAPVESNELVDLKTMCRLLGNISAAKLNRLRKEDPAFPVEYVGASPRFSPAKVRAHIAARGKKAAPKAEPKPRVEPVDPDIEFSDRELAKLGIRRAS